MQSDGQVTGERATPARPQSRDLGQDRFQALLRASLDALYCLEPASSEVQPQSFRFTDVNPPGEQLIDVPANELLGQTVHDVFTPANAAKLAGHLAQVQASGEAAEVEVSLEGDAESRLLRAQIVPLPDELLVKAYDITESRNAQEALRKSEEYLSSVVANAPLIMYELNHDGVFQLSTGRSLGQIGLSPGDAVGGSIYDFFTEDSPEVDAFRRALKGETVSTETRLGDGYFASRYTPRFDDSGEIVGILGVSYDVTERRQAEEKLQRAQRMEAVGQLTGGIAHDFNNLLAVILGNLDLLGISDTLDERSRQLIEQALAATQRGAALTKRLLAFSRRQLLEPRAVDVNQLIDSMLELLQHAVPENIDMQFERGQSIWLTHVDGAQLENAILNLCVNARDAMLSGGQLTVSTANVVVDAEAGERLSASQGEYVGVSVSDTGSGISPDVAKQIFEPFFTTKEVGKGSGLGLSMVYGFVNQSGGAIDLHSEIGEGTRITLLLPRATDAQVAAVHAETGDADLLPGHKELRLVVEDDAGVRQFVTEALKSLNYRVLEAGDGQAALDLLNQHSDIRLLLSDIVLPGDINGVDLFKRAKEIWPELKVILTTGYVGDVGEVDPQAIAELELIAKPYRVAELGQKVNLVLSS